MAKKKTYPKKKPLPYQKGYHRRPGELFKTVPVGKKHRKTVKRRKR